MKRTAFLLLVLLLTLLLGCRTQAERETPPAPSGAGTVRVSAPVPVEAAAAMTEAPTAEPEPAQNEAVIDPEDSHFSDTPVLTERSYRSSGVSIAIESKTIDGTYGRRVVVHIADVYVRDVTSIRTQAAQGDFGMRYTRLVKDIAFDAGALLAIDGDSYTHVKKSFVIRNGVLYRDTPIENTDLCVLYRDGVMETKKWGTFTAQEIIDSDPWQVWGFGPALLDKNGQSMEIRHELMGHNPRAAIGYYEPGHYCFVVVDGRGVSVGMTLNSLSRFMADLGCKAAYNLDGGASAQMYWNGEIISDPCSKGRVISDIIYILPEE